MTERYECPADGCEYTGVKTSVLGHYSGKRDETHKGGYKEAKERLTSSGDADQGSRPAESTSSTNETSTSSDAGDNPVFGSVDPDTQEEASTDSDAVELPCGCDTYDPREAPDTPYKVVCPDCNAAWRVTEE